MLVRSSPTERQIENPAIADGVNFLSGDRSLKLPIFTLTARNLDLQGNSALKTVHRYKFIRYFGGAFIFSVEVAQQDLALHGRRCK